MKKIFTPVLIFSLLCSCQTSHEGHEDHDHDHDHAKESRAKVSEARSEDEEEHHNPDEIILPVEKAEAAGVKVEKAETTRFSEVIRCSGKILPSVGDEATVVAQVAGTVNMNKSYTDGMAVGKGSPLFSISTAGLPDGDYGTRNRIAYDQAKAEYERAEKLMADKLITEKEYLAAKSEYERARLSYEAVSSSGSSKGINVKAPIGGYVKECLVTDGEYVNVGQPLMRISQNKNLFLRAEVPEREYDKIQGIRNARFRPSYTDRVYDVSSLGGRLVSSAGSSQSNGSVIPLTFEFNNTGGLLPGSYAEIYLIGDPRENVIAIPAGALTEEQGIYFVYIRVDEEGYVKKEVKIGGSDGERVEIIAGVNPGEEVVTEGAIHVKLASASNAIPAHSHNH